MTQTSDFESKKKKENDQNFAKNQFLIFYCTFIDLKCLKFDNNKEEEEKEDNNDREEEEDNNKEDNDI